MESREPQNNSRRKHFVSDTEKIIQRHLANKDDVITEDDIRNVRIGISPTEAGVDYPQMEGEQQGRNDRADNSPTAGQNETDQREDRNNQLPK